MNIPKKINTYCPTCKKHTEHKVSKIGFKKNPAKPRKMSWGQRSFDRKIKGYTSSVGEKALVIKQSKRNTLLLECPVCKKKHEKTYGSRTKKKAEFKKEV